MIRLITNVVGMICPLKQTGPSTDFVDGPENSKKCSLNRTNVIYFTTNACVVKQPSLKDNSSSRIALKSVMLMADQNGKIEARGCPTKRAPDAGDSAPFSGSFLRISLFLVGRQSHPRPSAGNANRYIKYLKKFLT